MRLPLGERGVGDGVVRDAGVRRRGHVRRGDLPHRCSGLASRIPDPDARAPCGPAGSGACVARFWLQWAAVHGLARDLRSALRQLRAAPGVSLAVIVALALGIGGNAALFGIVEALELRPLPLGDPERWSRSG